MHNFRNDSKVTQLESHSTLKFLHFVEATCLTHPKWKEIQQLQLVRLLLGQVSWISRWTSSNSFRSCWIESSSMGPNHFGFQRNNLKIEAKVAKAWNAKCGQAKVIVWICGLRSFFLVVTYSTLWSIKQTFYPRIRISNSCSKNNIGVLLLESATIVPPSTWKPLHVPSRIYDRSANESSVFLRHVLLEWASLGQSFSQVSAAKTLWWTKCSETGTCKTKPLTMQNCLLLGSRDSSNVG